MIDGYIVKVGDNVHDLVLKTGRVTESNADGSMTVRFGTRDVRYTAGGMLSGAKRLYWHDPILIVPRKNDTDRLALIQRLIKALEA